MNLFIEYHESKDLRRRGEFLVCLNENLKNEHIKRVHVFVEHGSELNIISVKLFVNEVKERPTFKTVFDYCNEHLAGQTCIIACADIILGDDIKLLNTNIDNTFVALTRWNIKYDGNKYSEEFYNNAASQDVWAFKAPIKVNDEMNFNFGACWGCDNKIAYLVGKEGYKVKNPSLQIKTKHLHTNDYRSVMPQDKKLGGPYLCLEPNDDINKDTTYIKLSGFDAFGQPLLCS